MNPKRLCALITVPAVSLLLMGAAMAVPSGKTLTFKGGKQGKVLFSGTTHAKAGSCNVCHPKLFKMKFGGDKITMAAIYKGQYCGACHNGKKAFAAKTSCGKCHKKK